MSDIREAYTEDGVNVAEGDSFSRFAARLCQDSYHNNPLVEVLGEFGGGFRGPRPFRLRVKEFPVLADCYMDDETDGLGTKPVLIAASGDLTGAPHDLFAMAAGDITRWGGMPFALTNLLDVSSLGELGDEVNSGYRMMMTELAIVAKQQGVILHKGETAEIGPCVGSDDPHAKWKFNWGATAFGLFHEKLMIAGQDVRAGDVVLALRDEGFRCNGISSVRKAFARKFGRQWWDKPEAEWYIKAAAHPSAIYDRLLAEANGWRDYGVNFEERIPIHAICHITGGALESKFFADLLQPRGLSAVLDDLFAPPTIMRDCARWRALSGQEAYAIWHGGQGALVVCPPEAEEQFLTLAVQHGIAAKRCGLITETKGDEPSLTVVSQFDREDIAYS